jgi:hypothetical protein
MARARICGGSGWATTQTYPAIAANLTAVRPVFGPRPHRPIMLFMLRQNAPTGRGEPGRGEAPGLYGGPVTRPDRINKFVARWYNLLDG